MDSLEDSMHKGSGQDITSFPSSLPNDIERMEQNSKVQLEFQSKAIDITEKDLTFPAKPLPEVTTSPGQEIPTESEAQPGAMEGILRHDEIIAEAPSEVHRASETDADLDSTMKYMTGSSVAETSRKDIPAEMQVQHDVSPTSAIQFIKAEAILKVEAGVMKTEQVHVPLQAASALHQIPEFSCNNMQQPLMQKYILTGSLVPSSTTPPFVTPKAPATQKPRKKPCPARTAKEMHMQRWKAVSKKPDAPCNKTVLEARKQVRSRETDSKAPKLGILNSLINHNAIIEQKAKHRPDKAPEYKHNTKKRHLAEILAQCPKTSNKQNARLDVEALQGAADRFGLTRKSELKPEKGKWRLQELKSTLFPHQVIGADFMLAQEFAPEGITGGICADGMGLGKTVQTLAVAVTNKPTSEDIETWSRSTLLVVPSSMVPQWESEVETHTHFEDVMRYESKNDPKKHFLLNSDIVITSFSEVIRSCPLFDEETLKGFKKADRERARGLDNGTKLSAEDDDSQAYEDWFNVNSHEAGLLHKIKWFRIVVDEAHYMKNRDSKLSLAVCALKGKNRWCLTGTPVMNSVEELYPYFRFIKDPDSKSFRMFRAKYCKRKADCAERLDVMLSKVMINRSMTDEFMGRPLLDLPTPHETIIKIDFNPSEKILYRAVEGHLRTEINNNLEDTASMKSSLQFQISPNDADCQEAPKDTHESQSDQQIEEMGQKFMLVRLIRLRQMTSYPLLIEHEAKRIFSIEKLRAIQKEILDTGGVDLRLYEHISTWIKSKQNREKEGLGNNSSDDSRCCILCGGDLADPIRLPTCTHCFCKLCIDGYITDRISAIGATNLLCPNCGLVFDGDTLKAAKGFQNGKSLKQPVHSTMGRDANGFIPVTTEYAWLQAVDAGKDTLLQSSKMKAFEDLLRTWLRDNPDEKFILFTQWIPFATIIGRALKRFGVDFLYFTGDMGINEREEAIAMFKGVKSAKMVRNGKSRKAAKRSKGNKSEKTIKVLVATLRTAGVGLNLACASRVISMDLWWNSCVERQAFGRVYRIGQERETYFVRIVVNDSIDARILDMQEKKMQMVSDVMASKLSKVETARLFGRVVKKNGRIRVVEDYDAQNSMDISGDELEDDEDDSEYDDDFNNDEDSDASYEQDD